MPKPHKKPKLKRIHLELVIDTTHRNYAPGVFDVSAKGYAASVNWLLREAGRFAEVIDVKAKG